MSKFKRGRRGSSLGRQSKARPPEIVGDIPDASVLGSAYNVGKSISSWCRGVFQKIGSGFQHISKKTVKQAQQVDSSKLMTSLFYARTALQEHGPDFVYNLLQNSNGVSSLSELAHLDIARLVANGVAVTDQKLLLFVANQSFEAVNRDTGSSKEKLEEFASDHLAQIIPQTVIHAGHETVQAIGNKTVQTIRSATQFIHECILRGLGDLAESENKQFGTGFNTMILLLYTQAIKTSQCASKLTEATAHIFPSIAKKILSYGLYYGLSVCGDKMVVSYFKEDGVSPQYIGASVINTQIALFTAAVITMGISKALALYKDDIQHHDGNPNATAAATKQLIEGNDSFASTASTDSLAKQGLSEPETEPDNRHDR